MKLLAIAAAAILLLVVVRQSTNFDFRAFYCAGSAVRLGGNPYHTEPLHACETQRADRRLPELSRKVAVPVPLPGYDIAGFALLSLLPYRFASTLWAGVLVLCVITTTLAARRICELPFAVVAVAFGMSLAVASISLGELVPICAAALCLAAMYARKGQWHAAGAFAAATLVEPHVGLPVCLSMLLWARRASFATVLGIVLLVAASLLAVGPAANIEYITSVLPLHAVSEIASDAQLSLSVVLHWLHVPDALALKFGAFSYCVMIMLAMYAARTLAEEYSDDSFIVTVPAAFCVIGGVFIHISEAALAVPLALLLIKHARSAAGPAILALALLSVPWWLLVTPVVPAPQLALIFIGVGIAYLVWRLGQVSTVVAAACGSLAAVVGSLLVYWHDAASAPYASIAHPPAYVLSGTYPELYWTWFNAQYMSTGTASTWMLRSLTWTGLFAAAFQSVRLAARSSVAP